MCFECTIHLSEQAEWRMNEERPPSTEPIEVTSLCKWKHWMRTGLARKGIFTSSHAPNYCFDAFNLCVAIFRTLASNIVKRTILDNCSKKRHIACTLRNKCSNDVVSPHHSRVTLPCWRSNRISTILFSYLVNQTFGMWLNNLGCKFQL